MGGGGSKKAQKLRTYLMDGPKGLPLQKSFEKVDVTTLRLTSFELNSSLGETFAVPLGFLVYFVVCK